LGASSAGTPSTNPKLFGSRALRSETRAKAKDVREPLNCLFNNCTGGYNDIIYIYKNYIVTGKLSYLA
jgi:hypothetical protein